MILCLFYIVGWGSRKEGPSASPPPSLPPPHPQKRFDTGTGGEVQKENRILVERDTTIEVLVIRTIQDYGRRLPSSLTSNGRERGRAATS